MTKRFEFRKVSAGYELLDNSQGTPLPFALVAGENSAKNTVEYLNELHEALDLARDHLEYCGWGDNWEREVADKTRLRERVSKALGEHP